MATEPPSQAIEPSPQGAKRRPRTSRRADTVFVGWFFCWPVLVVAFGPLGETPDLLPLFLAMSSALLWLASCFVVYDTLFTMAEARWPATKPIRKIMGSLFRGLLSHHHHSP
jgi:hypothetical protein